MFRSRTSGTPTQRLARMPSGTRLQLSCGAIFVKAAKRWMRAGVTGAPLAGAELIRLNDNVMPTVLVEASHICGEVA